MMPYLNFECLKPVEGSPFYERDMKEYIFYTETFPKICFVFVMSFLLFMLYLAISTEVTR